MGRICFGDNLAFPAWYIQWKVFVLYLIPKLGVFDRCLGAVFRKGGFGFRDSGRIFRGALRCCTNQFLYLLIYNFIRLKGVIVDYVIPDRDRLVTTTADSIKYAFVYSRSARGIDYRYPILFCYFYTE